MKNKILASISFLIVIAFMFSGCEKTPIDKANEDYNFNNVIPIVKSLNGLPAAIQIGRTYSLDVPIRGGSTFAWELLSGTGEFVAIPGYADSWKRGMYISEDISPVIIQVTETTAGGKTDSRQDTLDVTFTDFSKRPIVGPTIAPAGFSKTYVPSFYNANDKFFSTYTWETEGGEVTEDPVDTWKGSVFFSKPGDAKVKMIETNSHGLVAETSVLDILVINYCAIDDFTDFAGKYKGGDFNEYGINDDNLTFDVAVVDEGKRVVSISNFWKAFWGPNYWNESVTDGNVPEFTISVDGSITFENQLACQTEDEWNYYMGPRSDAVAYWTGCDDKIVLTIPYRAYWDDAYAYDEGYDCLIICELRLDGNKSSTIFNPEFNTKRVLPPLPIK